MHEMVSLEHTVIWHTKFARSDNVSPKIFFKNLYVQKTVCDAKQYDVSADFKIAGC
jgi:hypothetical protein